MLEPVAVLVSADGRRQARATEGDEAELQERLALRALLRVSEVDRAGPEVADGRRQARVVGQVPEPGVLRDERQLGVRQRDRQAGTELARDEAVTIRARIGGARSRTEPLDELAAQALAGDERDTVAPVAAPVAAADRDEEETQHHHRPTHHSRP